VLGGPVPFWDSRDDFGDTNMLVIKPEEGESLARALGAHWMVLMRRHGATVAGSTLRELVFRTVYSHFNAEMQLRSGLLGKPAPLTRGELELASPYQLGARPMERAWEYWTARLTSSPSPVGGKARTVKSRASNKTRATRKPARSARRGWR
jgi:HCOMODA/2-hydroxy-3-carboxy-muconic semialdehyde decarboxylase